MSRRKPPTITLYGSHYPKPAGVDSLASVRTDGTQWIWQWHTRLGVVSIETPRLEPAQAIEAIAHRMRCG